MLKAPYAAIIAITMLTTANVVTSKVTSVATKPVVKKFPPGCIQTGFVFKYDSLILKPKSAGNQQSLYFMHNKSLRKGIKLYQMKASDEPHNLQLNNRVNANQWGVFATNMVKVHFACTTKSKKFLHGKLVSCSDFLEICEYPNVKFSINNHGNYWSVISNSRRGAINNAIHQGILLKW